MATDKETKGRLKVYVTPLLGDVYLIPEKAMVPAGDDIVIVPNEANARRLAACWNAFEGVATADIDAMTATGGVAVVNAMMVSTFTTMVEVQMVIEKHMGEFGANMFRLAAERDKLRAELDAARALLSESADGLEIEGMHLTAKRIHEFMKGNK